MRFLIHRACFFALLFLAGCSVAPSVTEVPPPPVVVPPPPPPVKHARFVYTGDSVITGAKQTGSISGYSVDTSTGVLTPLKGFPLALDTYPGLVVADAQNRYLVAGDLVTHVLRVFAIDATTGALTLTFTLPTTAEPKDMVIDPAGKLLYVTTAGPDQVVSYSLSDSGELSPAPSGTLDLVIDAPIAQSMALNSTGSTLYELGSSNLYVVALEGDGHMKSVQQFSGANLNAVALDPDGTKLYVSDASQIVTYSVSAANGTLTKGGSSPAQSVSALAVSPTGKFAFAVQPAPPSSSSTGMELAAYALNAGSFSSVSTVPNALSFQLGIDPTGSFVYAPSYCFSNCPAGVSNVLHEYSIGSTGALTELPGSPLSVGHGSLGIAITTQ